VGNTVVQVNNIVGVRVPPLEIQAPEVVYRGDPYVVKVTWTGIDHGGGWVEAVEIVVDEEAVPVFVSGTSGYALSSVPLDSEDQVIPVISRIVDEFGRGFRAERLVRILDHPEPVVDLDLGREILDSLNQENRDLEEALLHEAYARTRVDRIWQEPFQMPVEGQITSRFGQRRRYATSWPVYSHLGIDIAAKVGTEIRAANSGVVVQAGFFPIRGGASIIDHGGGLSSLYFHQSRVGVEVGDFVERGGIIGQVGSTGVSTGPHLHWEVRLWGIPTNPIAWFDLAVPRAPHENY
jgi:murein DD-endopeptidase MepM/ murein hydrolase activator NlpD